MLSLLRARDRAKASALFRENVSFETFMVYCQHPIILTGLG